MARSSRRGRSGLTINAFITELALSLLALAVWQNRDELRKVLDQRFDLRLLGLGFLMIGCGLEGLCVPGELDGGASPDRCIPPP